MTRKIPPVLIIKFLEEDLKPWLVPLASLARALVAVQGLVSDEDEEESERPQLHLLDVKGGSASYPVSSEYPDRVIESIALTGHVIAHPQEAEESPHVLAPLKELSKVARAMSCEVELTRPNGDVLARIVPDTYRDISRAVFIKGESTVEGRILRVGGATDLHCGMRIHGQDRMLICSVEGTTVARELGHHLYEHAIVTGTATWYRKSWRLHHFVIKATHQIDQRSIVDRFDEVRRAGGSSWDDIDDADEFVKEIRGEG